MSPFKYDPVEVARLDAERWKAIDDKNIENIIAVATKFYTARYGISEKSASELTNIRTEAAMCRRNENYDGAAEHLIRFYTQLQEIMRKSGEENATGVRATELVGRMNQAEKHYRDLER